MHKNWVWTLLAGLIFLAACTTHPPEEIKPTQTAGLAQPANAADGSNQLVVPSIEAPFLTPRPPGSLAVEPTPDAPRTLPPMRLKSEIYVVEAGDTLAIIAQREGASVNDIIRANDLQNPDILSVGQSLTIPPPTPKPTGPDFKLLPDSELVNGPTSGYFDIQAYIQGTNGYLKQFSEEVDGEMATGAQIVQRVAEQYSVNPRLLLAVLEYRSGWLTKEQPKKDTLTYPAGWADPYRKGLYRQLAWVANNLNRGYYLWRVNGIAQWVLADGSYVPPANTINAATAGVQNLMGLYFGYDEWQIAVSSEGFLKTYTALFGNPFDVAFEPLIPPDLQQPPLILPFEPGQSWSFTGGPHAGWNDGSAWAAIDFAPPGEALGCVQSDAWVTAMADGKILRAGHGEVIEDLDGDGLEQTGWVLFYMHIETRDRVQPGTEVKAGDRIGHPSCEGGVSSGTHTHLARRYNGEWISADGSIPFNLEGWISAGTGGEYNGELRRDGQTIEAWTGRRAENQIMR